MWRGRVGRVYHLDLSTLETGTGPLDFSFLRSYSMGIETFL